jgi:hypothetical protein
LGGAQTYAASQDWCDAFDSIISRFESCKSLGLAASRSVHVGAQWKIGDARVPNHHLDGCQTSSRKPAYCVKPSYARAMMS